MWDGRTGERDANWLKTTTYLVIKGLLIFLGPNPLNIQDNLNFVLFPSDKLGFILTYHQDLS